MFSSPMIRSQFFLEPELSISPPPHQRLKLDFSFLTGWLGFGEIPVS